MRFSKVVTLLILAVACINAQYDGDAAAAPKAPVAPAVPADRVAAPPTCQLVAGTDCDKKAVAACGPGFTSMYMQCRKTFVQYCKAPEAAADTESCLKQRCDAKGAAPGKTLEKTLAVCRGTTGAPGLTQQCREQSCGQAAPADRVADRVAAPLAPCQDDRAIFIASDDDCTDTLQDEVDNLQLVVEKLRLLLYAKGVKVPEGCMPPVVPPTPTRKTSTSPPPITTTRGVTPTTKPGETTTPGGVTSTTKPGETTTPGEGTAQTTTTRGGGGEGKGAPPTTIRGGGGGEAGQTTTNTGNGTPPPGRSVTEGSSSGGPPFSPAALAGIIIGAAAAAGIAAVGIGLCASSAAAGGAAPASAAGMPAANTNPLYTPLTQGGNNPMYQ